MIPFYNGKGETVAVGWVASRNVVCCLTWLVFIRLPHLVNMCTGVISQPARSDPYFSLKKPQTWPIRWTNCFLHCWMILCYICGIVCEYEVDCKFTSIYTLFVFFSWDCANVLLLANNMMIDCLIDCITMQLWISYISFHQLRVVDLAHSFWVTAGCLTLMEILDKFWATITSNGSPCATGLLSCLTVTLVYCGQTAGWIRIPLGMEVGLGPDDIVLDGDPAFLTERRTAAPALFGPCLFRPNSRPS